MFLLELCTVRGKSKFSKLALFAYLFNQNQKRFISGHAKLPDVTELIFYCYLLPGILKVKDIIVAWHTVYYLN